MAIIDNTGERMIPEYSKGHLMYAEHMTRYEAALPFVDQKVVLDIASGSGYGAKLLASKAKKVYGVEVDKEAVSYANKQFGAKNIEFKYGDAIKIPLDDNSVDVIVTFETIEHIENYQRFVEEMDRILKPEGIVLISTPNSLEFSKGNHFHLHEFEYQELVDLVKPHFKYIDSYYQGTWKYAAIGDEDFIRKESKIELTTMNYAPLKPEQDLYFYLVCSRQKITQKLTPIGGIGEHYSDKDMSNAWSDSISHNLNLHDQDAQRIKSLETEVVELQAKVSVHEQELTTIKNSTSYKLATKLAKAKRTVTRGA